MAKSPNNRCEHMLYFVGENTANASYLSCFRVHDFPKDASCLFADLAHQLTLKKYTCSELNATVVRRDVINCINSLDQTLDKYLSSMLDVKTWGDENILYAAYVHYDVAINIWRNTQLNVRRLLGRQRAVVRLIWATCHALPDSNQITMRASSSLYLVPTRAAVSPQTKLLLCFQSMTSPSTLTLLRPIQNVRLVRHRQQRLKHLPESCLVTEEFHKPI